MLVAKAGTQYATTGSGRVEQAGPGIVTVSMAQSMKYFSRPQNQQICGGWEIGDCLPITGMGEWDIKLIIDAVE